MAIISISGRIGSGKDTVGKIIQIFTDLPHLNTQGVMSFLNTGYYNPSFKIKKFADALKDMICLMTGCTREQLEDQNFKNSELSEDWWYWKFERNGGFITQFFPYSEPKPVPQIREEDLELIKPTYRLLLQQLGTDCCRNQIHPNVWVNALFSKYSHKHCDWIITDMRFPNEMKAVKKRDGITIRVNRPKTSNTGDEIIDHVLSNTKNFGIVEHPSETSLDSAEFDEVINNNAGISELIEQVKEILIRRKIIQVDDSK